MTRPSFREHFVWALYGALFAAPIAYMVLA
jgi:hypothetical protein